MTDQIRRLQAEIVAGLESVLYRMDESDQGNAVRLLNSRNAKISFLQYFEDVVEEWVEEVGSVEILDTKEEQLKIVSEAMARILQRYPVAVDYKQRLWSLFCNWLKAAEKEFGVTVEMPLSPVVETEESKIIYLLKALHGQDGMGCGRKKLKEELGVSDKTLYTYLNRLNNPFGDYGKTDEKPWYLGGQLVTAPVKDLHEGRQVKVFTPDTVHPVVMQMNLTQTAFMLKSFCISYYKGGYGADLYLNLAYGIWCQLSDYAKRRIRRVFAGSECILCLDGKYPVEEARSFEAFLKLVEQKADHWTEEFQTEAELLERLDDSLDVMYALKSGSGMERPYLIKTKDQTYPGYYFYLGHDSARNKAVCRIVTRSELSKWGAEYIVKHQKGISVLEKDIISIHVFE